MGLSALVPLVPMVSGGSVQAAPRARAPETRYSVKAWGYMPAVEQVGYAIWNHVFYQNRGQTIRYPVLDLTGCTDHWVLDGLGSTFGGIVQKSESDNYYRLHAIPARTTDHIWIRLVPKDAGNHNCDIYLFNGWDSGTQIPTGDRLSGLTVSVAINP